MNFLMIAIINTSLLNPGPENNIKVYYQNVQGLVPFSNLGDQHPRLNRTKIFELNLFIHDNKPDVILLNETWLKKSVQDHEIIEDKVYKIFRKDRSVLSHPPDKNNPKKFRKNGGGVLIAVRDDIDATSQRISLGNGAEILALEINNKGTKFVFCTCYRVGTLGSDNHESITNSLKSFYKSKRPKKVFVVGDLNLSSVTWPYDPDTPISNNTEKCFIDTFNDLGLNQLIGQTTHKKGKILDLLLTNDSRLIDNISVHDFDSVCKSDHTPITFDVKTKVKRKKSAKRKCYNFKRANWEALNKDIRGVNWDALLDRVEPDIAWECFKKQLFEFVDKHIPQVTIKSEFNPPWFDSELYQACQAKEKARRKFKITKSKLDEINFSNARRHFRSLASQKMRDNMYNTDDANLITKKFWSHYKFANNSRRIPERMYRNDQFRTSPLDKANLFNEFFCDQFSDKSEYNVDIDFINDDKFDIDFCPLKISYLLSKINSNKANGPDKIHGKILKFCSKSIAYPLAVLFRLSYNVGNVPSEWKLANVVPIHKKGAKENIENYRPISLTSLVMKTFERLLKDKIMFLTHDYLNEHQHGFLGKKSCSTNMTIFSDSLARSLNEINTRTDVIYFDFAKAFDTVNHDILLFKLKHFFDIDGRLLKFIKEYLCKREQQVVIGNNTSTRRPVLSGVPQGSILGPILFVLFINDLPVGLNPGTNVSMYADDTKIWRIINSESDSILLQNDVDYLYNWSINNKMRFHPQKCKVVSVANRPPPLLDILPNVQFFYSLGQEVVDYAEGERDLGVDINMKLNYNEQCDRLLTKANQQFGLTKRTCYFVNDYRRKRALYLSLIRSQFEHCSVIWRPTNKTMLDRFENFQKKCIKWILGEEFMHYDSNEKYVLKCRQAKILPLEKRFDFNDLTLFFKVVNKLIPLQLPTYLKFFDGISRLRSCHLDSLCLVSELKPRINSTFSCSKNNVLNKSFFYRTHLLWNNLPFVLREVSSFSSFRINLLKFLWGETNITEIEDNGMGGVG